MRRGVVGAAAGLILFTGGAVAQTRDAFEPVTELKRVVPSRLMSLDRVERPVVMRPSARQAMIYQNTGRPYFRATQNPRIVLDDRFLTPGPGAGGRVPVTAQNPGWVVTDDWSGTLVSGVIVVEFFDTLNPNADPVCNLGPSNFLGGYAVAVEGMERGYVYQFDGMLDLAAAGIQIVLPDDDFGLVMRFFEDDSFTSFSPDMTVAFAGGDNDNNNQASTGDGALVGFSDDVYWRDVNGNMQFNVSEARYFNGYPRGANFLDEIASNIDASCPADFNGDGFLDFFDFDDFVSCFESEICPPGKTADFNGDGFADFFDFDEFIGAFARGC